MQSEIYTDRLSEAEKAARAIAHKAKLSESNYAHAIPVGTEVCWKYHNGHYPAIAYGRITEWGNRDYENGVPKKTYKVQVFWIVSSSKDGWQLNFYAGGKKFLVPYINQIHKFLGVSVEGLVASTTGLSLHTLKANPNVKMGVKAPPKKVSTVKPVIGDRPLKEEWMRLRGSTKDKLSQIAAQHSTDTYSMAYSLKKQGVLIPDHLAFG